MLPPSSPSSLPHTLLLDNIMWPGLRENVMMKYQGSGAELNYERLIFVLYSSVQESFILGLMSASFRFG